MKKVLSVILATIMLVSLFAVNASAMISKTYQDVMLSQDFSDETKLDFTAGTYGKTTVADGCVTLHTPSSTVLHVSSPTAVDETNWTLEFDVRRNSDFADTSYYGVIFTCNKSAYKGVQDKIDNYIENYGIYIPLMQNEKNVWYTYRITFDEQAVIDGIIEMGDKGYANGYASYLVTKAEYKKAGDSSWTTINDNKGWESVQGQARSLVRNQGNGYGFKGYPITVDGETVNTANEMSFVFRSPHSSYKATEEEEAAANFSLDNIKTYAAIEPEYPLTAGNILLSKENASVPDATNYVGNNMYTTNVLTTALDAPVVDAAGNLVSASNLTVTFDAKNTVQGLPIMIHIGGTAKCNGLTICPNDTIGTDWYSYKIVCSETNKGMNIHEVFRKPTGSDADYERMKVSGKYGYVAGDEFWAYGTPSGGKNDIRIFYYPETASAAVADTDPTKTVWEIENLQVTDDAVVAGSATVENGQITVNADTVVSANSAMYTLAVYDNEGRLIDVALENRASGIGEINLSADFVDGNSANLMIWNVTATGLTAPRIAPIDVDATLAE